jgi:lysophospholipase L1-like esterase
MRRYALPVLLLAVIAFLLGPLALAEGGNFAFPIGPATNNGLDAGTYPNLSIQPASLGPVVVNGVDAGTLPNLTIPVPDAGISQLTGQVTAGPGVGSQVATIAPGSSGNVYGGNVSNLIDKNSLIWGDITQPEWQGGPTSGLSPVLEVLAAQSADGSPWQDAVWVNPTGQTATPVNLTHDAFLPAGVTSANFELDVMIPPGGTATSVPMLIELQNTSILAQTSVGTCVTTSSWHTCSLSTGTLTPRTVQLNVQIPINYGSFGSTGASFLVSRARFIPTGTVTTPLFQSPESTPTGSFLRYEGGPMLWDNIHSDSVGAAIPSTFGVYRQFTYSSSLASFHFMANGQTSVGMEVLNMAWTVLGGSYPGLAAGVNIDGRPSNMSFAGVTSGVQVEDATVLNLSSLPAGNHEIAFVNGPQALNGLGEYPIAGASAGTFVKAAYSTTPLTILPPPKVTRKLVFWGDSQLGFAPSQPSQNGYVPTLRYLLGAQTSVVLEALASDTLFNHVNTPALLAQTAQMLTVNSPDFLVIEMGCNDATDGSWPSRAAFVAGYEAMLDAIHAVDHHVQMITTPCWIKSAAGGEGTTLANARLDVKTACNARPGYCTVIDTSANTPNWNTALGAGSSLYMDGSHLSAQGDAQAATYFAQQFTLLPPNTAETGQYFPAPTGNVPYLTVANVTPGSADQCLLSSDNFNTEYIGCGGFSTSGLTLTTAGAITLGAGSNVNLEPSGYAYISTPFPAFFSSNIGLGTTSDFGSGVKVIGIGAATTLPTTAFSTGDGAIAFDGVGAHFYSGANGNVATLGSITSTVGALWLNPNATNGNTNYVLSGGSTNTGLNTASATGEISVSFAGGSPTSAFTSKGLQVGSGTADFGSGTGALGISAASIVPSAAPSTGGDAVISAQASGLHFAGSSSSFEDWTIVPVMGGTASTQARKRAFFGQWTTTTAETAVTSVTIPVPASDQCVTVEFEASGRLASAITDATYEFGSMSWCSNGSTLTAGTPSTNTTIASAGSVVFTSSGTNALIQVESSGAITVDWTVTATAVYN